MSEPSHIAYEHAARPLSSRGKMGPVSETFGVPPALWEYQTTFRMPAGAAATELLKGFDEHMNADPPPVGAAHPGVPLREVAGWRLSADVTVPAGEPPFPVLVYLHGGGWSMGSPWTHRRLAAELTGLGLVVVSVDYRRAPKHPFPAAVDDVAFAVDWARENAATYGGDPGQLVIGGDSAGANLAASVLATGDSGVRAALLCYGVFDYHRMQAGMARLLGRPDPVSGRYLRPEEFDSLRGDPRLSPEVAADRFPPTLVTVGELDPLLPESEALAARLAAASVPHRLHVVPGAPHGYLQLPTHPSRAEGIAVIADFLQEQGIKTER
ncbi:hypothetical protein GCM10023321_79640 [Pseudonocardia eucalypti]|uniref:Alpha/beta hydrolase fold-3 domain-containing protein n=1 Tax=Pseudonocardia eucalypti TaxID=648755 RepID=A0ABP9RC01_9PSEU